MSPWMQMSFSGLASSARGMPTFLDCIWAALLLAPAYQPSVILHYFLKHTLPSATLLYPLSPECTFMHIINSIDMLYYLRILNTTNSLISMEMLPVKSFRSTEGTLLSDLRILICFSYLTAQFFHCLIILQLAITHLGLTVSRHEGLCHFQDIAHALHEVSTQ